MGIFNVPKNIRSKPCKCPKNYFHYVEKIYEEENGPYKIIHKFEIIECKFHMKSWGTRRNEYQIKKPIKIISPLKLNENEENLLKKKLVKLWDTKIKLEEWNKTIQTLIKDDKLHITESLIQKGIIEIETKFYSGSNKILDRLYLTEYGKSNLKGLFNFYLKEEQLIISRKMLLELFENIVHDTLPESKKVLYQVLRDQLNFINNGNPEWILNNNNKVFPKKSIGPSDYLYLVYAFASWFRNWEPRVALNNLSYKIYKENSLPFTLNPSKQLSRYITKIDSILKQSYSCVSKDLGLIKDKIKINIPAKIKGNKYSWKVIYKNGKIVKLGGGGQAFVILVQNEEDKCNYAMKIYSTIEESYHSNMRYQRELQILQKLSLNKNIIEIIDWGSFYTTINRIKFFVMELADCSLYDKIKKENLSNNEIFKFYIQFLNTIEYFHKQGIIHRDLKPTNILLKDNSIKIIDFGISLDISFDRFTYTGEIVGSRFYIAPELLSGRDDNIDLRADFYSIGKVLYFILSSGKIFPREYYFLPENQLSTIKKNSNFSIFNQFFEKTINEERNERFLDIKKLKENFILCFNKCFE